MEIQVAVSKINMYDSRESGDTLEVVERPNGGISVVLADPHTSGKMAKAVSSLVVRKVISLLAEGIRDGAAARAASDLLYTEKEGQVTVYLNILSVDFETGTIVLTRNNPTPVFLAQRERVECLSGESVAIGSSRNIRPLIAEIPLEAGTIVVLYTDGLSKAGERIGQGLDVCTLLESLLDEQEPYAQEIADTILEEAIRLDQGRPNDDMSVVVLRVSSHKKDDIRRLAVRIPFSEEDESL